MIMIKNAPYKQRIILASASPRRQQLLAETGLDFVIISKDFPEKYPNDLKGRQIAEFLSREKASLFIEELTENDILITADTIVWCGDRVLGKPIDKTEAINMLKTISGTTHEVITGVTIISRSGETTFSDSTKVTFDDLSDEEINHYIDSFKPYDKAGAYGIQEWIGIIGCSRIEGSYFNVVGLPVQRLYKELAVFINK